MLPQFDTSTLTSQFFWFLICFISALIFIFKFLTPVYRKTLDKRISLLDQDIKLINKFQIEILEIKKERIEKIEKAKQDAQITLEKAFKEISKDQEKVLKEAEEKHHKALDELDKTMTEQKNQILSDIQPFINESVKEIMQKFAKE